MKPLVVAIDGPAGAGKSSIAKMVAQQLGYLYIDTGAMYRAVTYKVLENNISPEDENEVGKMLSRVHLEMKPDGAGFRVFMEGDDVTDQIRSKKVNDSVSAIATLPTVRTFLVEQQREMARIGGVILDGRDIASVVLPNADVKIYLTASVEARAKRRWLEEDAKGSGMTMDQVKENVIHRDYTDMNRVTSPLVCVPEAHVVDSSNLSIEETVREIMAIILNTNK